MIALPFKRGTIRLAQDCRYFVGIEEVDRRLMRLFRRDPQDLGALARRHGFPIGDARLLDKLRREELIPLGSRIRTRLATGVATREELLACLEHLLTTAGNAGLMTKQLRNTLCDHAAGNYRIFIGMAAELLMTAAQREIIELDEKLYLQVFAPPETQTPRRAAAAR